MIVDRDLKHIWHPCSQMKDYETLKPLDVVKAKGGFIELRDGKKIFDAISSWWCKSLGHQHPRLKQALLRQLDQFEHVILANTTNETIVALSEKLATLSPSLDKVFYASDGSCAVEIAMKMSLHTRVIKGEAKRNQFIALENAYHGETVGAMSVSDLGIYRSPYQPMLFEVAYIKSLPYVQHRHDERWHDSKQQFGEIETMLEPYADTATALLVEPIVQGAGGMRIYSQDFLSRLRQWTRKHDIHLIADEIMTGMGRTGKMLACEHAGIEPDFVCLSKGLTAGFLPMSAVLTSKTIYDIFYSDYLMGQSFLHSHTFSGHALAASVALEVFNVFAEENICKQVELHEQVMRQHWTRLAGSIQEINNIRGIGSISAIDLSNDNPKRRLGFEVYQQAIKLGALLRPLGDTIYWAPPLNTTLEELDQLANITEQAIKKSLAI